MSMLENGATVSACTSESPARASDAPAEGSRGVLSVIMNSSM